MIAVKQLCLLGIISVLCRVPVLAQQQPDPRNGKDQTSPAQTSKPVAPSQKADKAVAAPLGPPRPPSLQELLGRASQLLRDQKPVDAAKVYREAITIYATSYQPYDRLARLAIGAHNYTEAATAAQKATELNTDNPGELVQEYSILGSALAEQGKYAAAREAADHCIELAPHELDYRLLRGEIDMRAKDYPNAETSYLAALGLTPDSFRVHSALGDVYEQENRHQSALLEYEAALRALGAETKPDEEQKVQLQMSQATALAGLKRYAEAEAQVRALVASQPNNPTVHSSLAQVLDAAGKHKESIAEYRLALAKSPEDAVLWGNLGWAQYNAGEYDDAILSSRKALEIDPKQVYVRFNIGLIFAVRNRWAEALKEYQSAVGGAAEPDIRAAINDVRDALDKTPDVAALRQASQYLTNAERKALGFPD